MVTSGDNDPTALTPEERVDQAISQARYGQAGIGSLGIGQWMDSGGGGGGQFVFANLDELDATLREWTELCEEIDKHRGITTHIQSLCNPPAEDTMSHYQAAAGMNSAAAKLQHDDALWGYAQAYVDKLTACRTAMAATEQANADGMRGTGEELDHG